MFSACFPELLRVSQGEKILGVFEVFLSISEEFLGHSGVFSACFSGFLRVRKVRKILGVSEVSLVFPKRPRKRRTE